MTAAEDPHHWLEDDSPEALAWQESQNALAEERLRSWPGRAQLAAAVAARRHASLVFAPQRFGKHWFELVSTEEGREPALYVGDRLGDHASIVVDPNTWPGTAVSLDWFSPSPDGAFVAFGLSERGSEQSVLHVRETRSGRLLQERIPYTSFGVVAWLPDESGFFYNASLGPDTEQPQKHIFLHRLGDDVPSEPEPAIVREDEEFIFPQVSADGRWVVAVSSEVEPRPDSIREVDGDGAWQSFLVGCPGHLRRLRPRRPLCGRDDQRRAARPRRLDSAGHSTRPLDLARAGSRGRRCAPKRFACGRASRGRRPDRNLLADQDLLARRAGWRTRCLCRARELWA